mmetsp:Transcript_79841/g.158169  ORF Transcript_79841/g.158169 Transcript_79841/m.158169 type:complete len:92 (+) Transcript_79841:753-1028(+)
MHATRGTSLHLHRCLSSTSREYVGADTPLSTTLPTFVEMPPAATRSHIAPPALQESPGMLHACSMRRLYLLLIVGVRLNTLGEPASGTECL